MQFMLHFVAENQCITTSLLISLLTFLPALDQTATASIEFPGISVSPREIPPVNLFQSEGSGTGGLESILNLCSIKNYTGVFLRCICRCSKN